VRKPGGPEPSLLVRIRRLPRGEGLTLPRRESDGAAGYDVRSAEDDFVLEPGEIRLAGTGLVLQLPAGIECQVRPRSGLAVRFGVTLPNSPGTIDPDYRGELKVPLQNLGPEPVPIRRGDRIAQLVFARFERPRLVEVEEMAETERGSGGFGSTGVT